MTIQSYYQAAEYLGSKTDWPLPGRATRLQRRDETTIAVKYQRTDVVTYRADGLIVLQSGGWQTFTTKARFAEYSRARVSQSKGVWYMRVGESWDNPQALYYDGVIVDNGGNPMEPRYPTPSDSARKRSLDRLVSAYITGFAAYIDAGKLQQPDNGDCWGCLFQVKDAPEVTQGERCLQRPTPHGRVEPMGVSHYLDHLKESYFVPSLLFNAIKARGYRDPGFIWGMIARPDGAYAAGILRQYFRTLKPALLAEFQP